MKTDFLKYNDQFIDGPLVLTPQTFFDERGFFFESWNERSFINTLKENTKFFDLNSSITFVQDNQSLSKKNILRGLHYQIKPFDQGKLVSCIKGEIFDVIVDLRKESKTFGKWAGIYLSEKNFNQIWIPSGFAHGFYSLKDQTRVLYKTTNFWNKDSERTILWNDPNINICWPTNGLSPSVSNKDKEGSLLIEIIENELF